MDFQNPVILKLNVHRQRLAKPLGQDRNGTFCRNVKSGQTPRCLAKADLPDPRNSILQH